MKLHITSIDNKNGLYFSASLVALFTQIHTTVTTYEAIVFVMLHKIKLAYKYTLLNECFIGFVD